MGISQIIKIFVATIIFGYLASTGSLAKASKEWANLHSNVEYDIFEEDDGCVGANYTACLEELLAYIKMGEEQIKISDKEFGIIVVGLTKVGKSTLVQFVANSSNPLIATCIGSSCNITDDSGSVGDSIISQTFLPNLVTDNGTAELTPFYDMPGFNDNRAVVVEVANSFFVKHILKHVHKVKVVVLVSADSFTVNDASFPLLLEDHLLRLIKNPQKFNESLLLIANRAKYHEENEILYIDYNEYYKLLLESLDVIIENDELIEAAREMLSILFRVSNPEDPDNPNFTNVGIMRTPYRTQDGQSIRDDDKFSADYQKLRDLIYDHASYVNVTEDDFGFAVSLKASVFLEKATDSMIEELKQIFSTVAQEIVTELKTDVDGILNGVTDTEELKNRMLLIAETSFDFLTNCTTLPSLCIQTLINATTPFSDTALLPYLDTLNSRMGFLDYISAVKVDFVFNSSDLVTDLSEINNNVRAYITTNTTKVLEPLITQATRTFNANSIIVINENLGNYSTLEDKDTFKLQLAALSNASYTQCQDSENEVLGCLSAIKSNVENFGTDTGNVYREILLVGINFASFCKDLEIDIEMSTELWSLSLKDIFVKVDQYAGQLTLEKNNQIISLLAGFSDTVTDYFLRMFNAIGEGKEVDSVEFSRSLTALSAATFSQCLNLDLSNITTCTQEFSEHLPQIHKNSSDLALPLIIGNTEILLVCRNDLGTSPNYDTLNWASRVANIKSNVMTYVTTNTTKTLELTITQATRNFNTSSTIIINGRLANYPTLEDKYTFKLQLAALKNASYPECESSENEVLGCLSAIKQNVEKFGTDTENVYNEILLVGINFASFCEDLEIDIEMSTELWSVTLMDILVKVNQHAGQLTEQLSLEQHDILETLTEDFYRESILPINSNKDISDIVQGFAELLNKSETAKASLSQFYQPSNFTLSGFLGVTKTEYERMNDRAFDPNERLSIEHITVIEEFGEFPWKQYVTWTDVHENKFHSPLKKEAMFSRFVSAFYSDFSTYEIQSEKKGNFHTWWSAGKQIELEVLEDLYSKALASLVLGEVRGLGTAQDLYNLIQFNSTWPQRIKNILDFALLSPGACPTSPQIDTVITGNFVSLKLLSACSFGQVQVTRRLAIIATHTVFLDADIVGSEFSSTNNLILTIIAPNWHITNGQKIDLSGIGYTGQSGSQEASRYGHGMMAQPGRNGERAGIMYGIFLNLKGAPIGLNFLLNGGRGGDGAVGEVGRAGTHGSTQGFVVDQDCDGFSGGSISIYKHPNTCNSNVGGKCNANPSKTVTIQGTPGTPGGPGGPGGNGGEGGAGGQSVLVNLNDPVPSYRNGSSGPSGLGGQGGAGGTGGRNGDKLVLDLAFRGGCGYYCDLQDQRTTSGGSQDDGAQGTRGTQPPPADPQTVLFDDFKGYVRQMIARAEIHKEKEFVNKLLKDFLTKINSHASVPKLS